MTAYWLSISTTMSLTSAYFRHSLPYSTLSFAHSAFKFQFAHKWKHDILNATHVIQFKFTTLSWSILMGSQWWLALPLQVISFYWSHEVDLVRRWIFWYLRQWFIHPCSGIFTLRIVQIHAICFIILRVHRVLYNS